VVADLPPPQAASIAANAHASSTYQARI
jgi:hypothetical protein